jgi:hypothetical protein
MSISLDGVVAGPDQSLEHLLGCRGIELHRWHLDEPLHDVLSAGGRGRRSHRSDLGGRQSLLRMRSSPRRALSRLVAHLVRSATDDEIYFGPIAQVFARRWALRDHVATFHSLGVGELDSAYAAVRAANRLPSGSQRLPLHVRNNAGRARNARPHCGRVVARVRIGCRCGEGRGVRDPRDSLGAHYQPDGCACPVRERAEVTAHRRLGGATALTCARRDHRQSGREGVTDGHGVRLFGTVIGDRNRVEELLAELGASGRCGDRQRGICAWARTRSSEDLVGAVGRAVRVSGEVAVVVGRSRQQVRPVGGDGVVTDICR